MGDSGSVAAASLRRWVQNQSYKSHRRNPEYRTHAEALEARLELARELNEGETKAIAAICNDIVELKKLIGSDKQFSQLEPLLTDVDERTDALVVANRTTDHLLNAKKLAIGE